MSATATHNGRERTDEERMHSVLAHRLRARIIDRLGSDRVATPKELAAELGVTLGVCSYHVRMLHDYGVVVLDHVEPKRGALQHFYRLIEQPAASAQGQDLRAQLERVEVLLVEGMAATGTSSLTYKKAEQAVAGVRAMLDGLAP